MSFLICCPLIRRTFVSLLFVMLSAVFLYPRISFAKPMRFEVRDAAQRDSIQVTSDAQLEKIVAINSAVLGWVEIDPDQPRQGVKGEVEIDLRSFVTGNASRDSFLREKLLSTSEFPTAKFVINKPLSFASTRLVDQQPTVVRLEGTFTIRGQIRTQPILVKFTYFKQSDKTSQRLPGNLLRITSSFDLDLSSFGITIPEGLKFRVGKIVQANIDLIGNDGPVPSLTPVISSAPGAAAAADGPKSK